jgi:hypothetical protein
MTEWLQRRGVIRAIRPLLVIVLSLLIGFGGALPAMQANASAPITQMSGDDCPLHGGKQDLAKLGCCILCSMPSLVTASGAEPFNIPLRLSLGVALHFATGVSATYGPALTANLATGPPAA